MSDRIRSVRLSLVLTLAALAAFANTAAAQDTAQTNFNVTATVVNRCTISADDLGFGTYDPTSSAPVTAENTLTVSCTKGAAAWIGLDEGQNYGEGSRRMLGNGTEYLPYELYQESGYGTLWGNAASSGKSYTSTSRASQALTVYGRIPAGADVSKGAFTDRIQATINF